MKKKAKKATQGKGAAAKPDTTPKSKGGSSSTAGGPVKKKIKIRPPRSAAVILTPTVSTLSRAEVMAEARRRVKLEEIEITYIRSKIAATGAIILEVPGEDSAPKADRLAERLRTALADKEVRITRPTKSAELRIGGLDESITREDLAIAVAGASDCSQDDIRIGEIRRNAAGLGVAWIKCPAVAARRH